MKTRFFSGMVNHCNRRALAALVFCGRQLRALPRYGVLAAFALGAAGGAQAQAQPADLMVSQTYAPNPMPAGTTATYTITVANAGPGSASAVQLTDVLPPGSVFVSVTPAAGSCSTSGAPVDSVNCNLGNLALSASTTVVLKITLPDKGVWKNQVAVSSATPDPNLSNNQSDVSITVVGNADLSLAASSDKGASPGNMVRTGEPYNYTLAVTNHGPDDLPAGGVATVSFNVPAGAMITSPPGGPGWACTPAGGYPLTDTSVLIKCSRDDGLVVGASFPALTVPAVANQAQAGNITANFGLESTFPDGNQANNLPVATVYVSPDAASDVGIVKTGPFGTVAAGLQVTYTLTAAFHGGVNPTNVTVTDELPAGLGYAGYTAATPWNCTFAAPRLTCVYPGAWTGGFTDLPPITLKATVINAGQIVNTALAAADQIDPVPGNNTSTAGASGANDAQLVITKTPNLPAVMVGDMYLYSVVVRNAGPAAIKAGQVVTLTESLPAGMQLALPISGADWACTSNVTPFVPIDGAATITCTYTAAADVAAMDLLPLIGIWVINTVPGSLTNSACVDLGAGSLTPADNPSKSSRACDNPVVPGTLVGQGADLSITKSADKSELAAGQVLTYTLTVRNNGPRQATNVRVSDVLADLLSAANAPYVAGLVSATPSQGACTPAGPADGSVMLDCNVGTLAAGAQATVTIVIHPDNATAADLVRANTATVHSMDVGDPNPSDNTSGTVQTTVHPRVDVVVHKSVTPAPLARVGEPLVYVVTARNDGPSTALNVATSDAIPPNTAFIDVVGVTGGATCNWPAAGATSGTLACTWPSIAPYTQYTVTYRLRPLTAALGTDVVNTVHIATDSVESNTANNSASASVHIVEPQLDVLVTKQGSADPVLVGDDVTYTITIKNVGMSFGSNLVMTDAFPAAGSGARLSYQGSLSAPGATCTQPAIGATSGTLRCTWPVIAPGDANAITVSYKMRAQDIIAAGAWSGTHVNHVEVSVDEPETTLANNQTDARTTVRLPGTLTNLAITKQASRQTVARGDQISFTLVVENKGSDVLASDGAQVTDTLPDGLSFVSATSGCQASGATVTTVTCAVGALAAGGQKTFVIVTTADARLKASGTLVNQAQVSITGDADPSDNTSSVTMQIASTTGTPSPIPTLNLQALLTLLAAVAGLAGMAMARRGRRWR